jgi:hypothetical protein
LPQCIIAQVLDLIAEALQRAKEILTFCDPVVHAAESEATWRNSIVIDTDIANLNTAVNNHLNQLDQHLTSIDSQVNAGSTAVDTDLTSRMVAVDADIAARIAGADSDLTNKITGAGTVLNTQLNSVDADVLNQGTQISNAIATFQTLDVRVEIERSLAQGLVIGLFEVPVANGGYLETVRAIVNDTISKLLAAGQTINGATKWLALGDTALAAKQFKSAYQDYMTAYQTGAK